MIQPPRPPCLVLETAHVVDDETIEGARITLGRAIGKYYWPTRYEDIEHYCRSCVSCQLVGPKLPKEPAHSIAVLDPMVMFGIDYIGLFNPPSSRGHRYILIGVDYMSRFAWGIPTMVAKSTTSAAFMKDDVAWLVKTGPEHWTEKHQNQQFHQ
ncbi:hypothetical protein N7513_006073 [Penicillium frequentans]|nr:hypothetical protein N7513_006073 [Penicillium glabrum]